MRALALVSRVLALALAFALGAVLSHAPKAHAEAAASPPPRAALVWVPLSRISTSGSSFNCPAASMLTARRGGEDGVVLLCTGS